MKNVIFSLIVLLVTCLGCSTYRFTCSYGNNLQYYCTEKFNFEGTIGQGCVCQAKDWQGNWIGEEHYGIITKIEKLENK